MALKFGFNWTGLLVLVRDKPTVCGLHKSPLCTLLADAGRAMKCAAFLRLFLTRTSDCTLTGLTTPAYDGNLPSWLKRKSSCPNLCTRMPNASPGSERYHSPKWYVEGSSI